MKTRWPDTIFVGTKNTNVPFKEGSRPPKAQIEATLKANAKEKIKLLWKNKRFLPSGMSNGLNGLRISLTSYGTLNEKQIRRLEKIYEYWLNQSASKTQCGRPPKALK